MGPDRTRPRAASPAARRDRDAVPARSLRVVERVSAATSERGGVVERARPRCVTRPRLPVIRSVPAVVRTGSRPISARMRSAACSAVDALRARQDHHELLAAEPAHRVVDADRALRGGGAISRSTSSPTTCPYVSFTCLKWSRSTIARRHRLRPGDPFRASLLDQDLDDPVVVPQAGQRVVSGGFLGGRLRGLELGLDPLALGDVADQPDEHPVVVRPWPRSPRCRSGRWCRSCAARWPRGRRPRTRAGTYCACRRRCAPVPRAVAVGQQAHVVGRAARPSA